MAKVIHSFHAGSPKPVQQEERTEKGGGFAHAINPNTRWDNPNDPNRQRGHHKPDRSQTDYISPF